MKCSVFQYPRAAHLICCNRLGVAPPSTHPGVALVGYTVVRPVCPSVPPQRGTPLSARAQHLARQCGSAGPVAVALWPVQDALDTVSGCGGNAAAQLINRRDTGAYWGRRFGNPSICCIDGNGDQKNENLALGPVFIDVLAEAVRFELTDPCGSAVFKTAGLNRSPKPPGSHTKHNFSGY